MENQWKIRFWGTRGSMPRAGKEFLEYGGNTSCISVDWGGAWVVLDGGSGLINLGHAMKGNRDLRPVHILFSHLHMDHIMGLFGFGQLYEPGAEIHLYGESRAGVSFRQQLDQVTGSPYWPMGLGEVPAQVRLHQVEPGQQFCLEAGGRVLRVSILRGIHPGGSLLYRLDGVPGAGDDRRLSGTSTVSSFLDQGAGTGIGEPNGTGTPGMVYGLDCELDQGMSRRLAKFAAGVDVLVWDAHFTQEDLKKHQGWGHSSWEQGVVLGKAAGAARTVMTHFAPEYTDDFLRQQEAAAREADGSCCFAREGMEISI